MGSTMEAGPGEEIEEAERIACFAAKVDGDVVSMLAVKDVLGGADGRTVQEDEGQAGRVHLVYIQEQGPVNLLFGYARGPQAGQ